jgi:predicted dehydrogenase
MRKGRGISRREFLGGAAAAAAAFTLVPRHVVAASGQAQPSARINLACVGMGGQGTNDLKEFSADGGVNIVAICDVDWKTYEAKIGAKKYPDPAAYAAAKRYTDFRKMFEEMDKGIDAVLVATPDHNHAVVSMAALKRGKHVFCEKPLAHSVGECRALAAAAKAGNVVTQLGNQGHSSETIRMFCEWIQDGAIGQVKSINVGSPAINSGLDQLRNLKEKHAPPEGMDWDLWLGPAQERPFHPAYHPYNWRGWVPFGGGTVGDWVCHVVDPIFWAFDLGAPAHILAEAKDYDPKTQGDAFPKTDHIVFEFPAKGARGPLTVHWYSGQELPRAADLEPDRQMKDIYGVVVGAQGSITYGSHGAGSCRIIPEARMKAYKLPPKKLPRVGNHYFDFLKAIRGGTKSCSDFSYGAPLSEIAMLGLIALKFPGTKLEWDAAKMQFTHQAAASACVNPAYRAGWTL